MMTKSLASVAAGVLLFVAGFAPAQSNQPMIQTGAAEKVSESVHVIPDNLVSLVPNIGIVTGSEATLVVDTGHGPRNGRIVLQEVNHLGPGDRLYVVTTHYHPEHSLGVAGLGDNAQLIIPRIQQQEMDNGDVSLIENWRNLFQALMSDIRALKEEGIPEADAAEILNSEYVANYPQWRSEPRRMNAAVRAGYRELP